MTIAQWVGRAVPDLSTTLRRFPLPVLLAALATAIVLYQTVAKPFSGGEFWFELTHSSVLAATLAVGGALFRESRPDNRLAGALLAYALPLVALVLPQLVDSTWYVQTALFPAAIMWTSIAAFTRIGRGWDRNVQQDRYWWLNHQALSAALIAIAGFLLLLIGIFAIDAALSRLFNIDTHEMGLRVLAPIFGGFLAPLYWLANLPEMDAFDPKASENPDFLSRAIGLIGTFLVTPLLLVYGVLLVAYAVQILVTQTMPEGQLGWMVLGFLTSGAANWLLLYPAFLRERPLVKFFHRWWFWLTLVPTALFVVAVYMRIDYYGLTPERMLLVAGAIWAVITTGAFPLGRGDIRLFAGAGALVLVLVSVGPWNMENLSRLDQARRLESAMISAGMASSDGPVSFSPEAARRAHSAIAYLYYQDGRALMGNLLRRYQVPYTAELDGPETIALSIGLTSPREDYSVNYTLQRDFEPVDVSATPIFIGQVNTYSPNIASLDNMRFEVVETALRVSQANESVDVDLSFALEHREKLLKPYVDFTFAGRNYRYVINLIAVSGAPELGQPINYVEGTLFAATPSP